MSLTLSPWDSSQVLSRAISATFNSRDDGV